MSDKIYAFLLRLYPARFRRHYEAEALQLFRDRMRDERGLMRRLRLFADMVADFPLGLPQAWRNTYAMAETTPAWQPASGLPSFRTLEEEPLRPSSVAMGTIFAVAALALFVFVMSHAPAFHRFSNSIGRLGAAATGSRTNPGNDTNAQAEAERIEHKNRSAALLEKCSVEKLEQHPGNIGYVKLTWFANPDTCQETAEAVMERLSETDAVIFDLRDCGGGYPEMVRLIAGWLFDRPVPWYNPRATSPAQSVTDSPVPGSTLAHKPVFVLTSSHTFSGAEHFAWNLKTLKRATLIGETTSGASHAQPGAQSGAQPNPIALSAPKPAWEGTGVAPDIRVKAAEALRVAESLAQAAIRQK